MKKALISIILFCMLTASLTACLTQKPDPAVHINEDSDETITLSMFAPVGRDLGTSESFRDLTLKYNELSDQVQVTFDGVSTADGYDRFLEERLDAGNRVDVFVVNAENVKEIAAKEQFYDLSGLEGFQMLTESAKEQAVIGDVGYTVPLKMAVYVMGVNVSLLKRHGLKVPQNYEEFLSCCRTLKEQDITPIALNRWFAMTAPVMANSLYPLYQAENRDELIEGLNSGKIQIGDYMENGFRMFQVFLDEGFYGDNLVAEEVDTIKAGTQDEEDFKNGRAAFRFLPIDELDALELENGDECIYTGLPMLPDGVITLPSISVRLCVNANSGHLEEAVSFAGYVTSKRLEIIAQETSQTLSPFRNTAAADSETPWKQAILNLMDSGHQIPIEDMNVHFGYWDNTRALCLAMIDGMPPEEAAEEFNRLQIEQIQSFEGKTR